MIIIGAGGYAKELLEVLLSTKYNYSRNEIHFFDNISSDLPEKIYSEFKIIRSLNEAKSILNSESKEYCIGIGNPHTRQTLNEIFENLTGQLTTIISSEASIGSFNTKIENGCTIMDGARITNSVSIGKGCLINLNVTIGHDTTIGDFVELNPGVHISGKCLIGNNTSLGTGAVILPKIKIGNNVKIGAGSVVINDIPDDCTVVGVPGKII